VWHKRQLNPTYLGYLGITTQIILADMFFFEANYDDVPKPHLPTHITVQVIPQVLRVLVMRKRLLLILKGHS